MKIIKRFVPVAVGVALLAAPCLQSISFAKGSLLAKSSSQTIAILPPDGSGTSTKPKRHKPLLKEGLHPKASDALRKINVPAHRIIQTIGNAAASSGFHLPDGTVNGKPYTTAVDLSTRGLSNKEVKRLLENLGTVGFAAWFRNPGQDGWPSSEAEHIHAVYAGVPMKDVLDNQVRDYLHQKNGLASHTTYRFYQWSHTAKAKVARLFKKSN